MKLIFFYLIVFFFFINVFADTIEVRGYQFGETRAFILNKEAEKKEFQLNTTRTNLNQLVYQGILFNKPVNLIYFFRNNRLSRFTYIWEQKTMDQLFYQHLKKLLSTKYSLPEFIKFPAEESVLEINNYTQFITNNNAYIPILFVSLEQINFTNSNQTLILEFKAYDSDLTIKNKILKEDI